MASTTTAMGRRTRASPWVSPAPSGLAPAPRTACPRAIPWTRARLPNATSLPDRRKRRSVTVSTMTVTARRTRASCSESLAALASAPARARACASVIPSTSRRARSAAPSRRRRHLRPATASTMTVTGTRTRTTSWDRCVSRASAPAGATACWSAMGTIPPGRPAAMSRPLPPRLRSAMASTTTVTATSIKPGASSARPVPSASGAACPLVSGPATPQTRAGQPSATPSPRRPTPRSVTGSTTTVTAPWTRSGRTRARHVRLGRAPAWPLAPWSATARTRPEP